MESAEFCSLPARNNTLSSVFSNSSNRWFSRFACILHFSFNRKSSFYFSRVWPIFRFFEAFIRKYLPFFILLRLHFLRKFFFLSLPTTWLLSSKLPLFLTSFFLRIDLRFLFPSFPQSSHFSFIFSHVF